MGVQLETLCHSHLYSGQAKGEGNGTRRNAMLALALQDSAAFPMMAVSNANRA